ncbi:MAG: hypothetical protein IIY21_28120 [Clostridiales bacterium]|nr:hypothetical protein [Clostridiales bacterium]
MLLMENEYEGIDKDKVIEGLKASNRELAHQLSDLRDSRDLYKHLYYELINRLMERVNIEG